MDNYIRKKEWGKERTFIVVIIFNGKDKPGIWVPCTASGKDAVYINKYAAKNSSWRLIEGRLSSYLDHEGKTN